MVLIKKEDLVYDVIFEIKYREYDNSYALYTMVNGIDLESNVVANGV